MLYDLIYVFAIIVLAGFLSWLLQRSPITGDFQRWGQWIILAVAGILVFIILLRLILASVATVA